MTLRYGEEAKIITERDTLKISILDISDECSEESARVTFGCKSTIKLSLRLNNNCKFITNYSLEIPRYGKGEGSNFISIDEVDCRTRANSIIDSGPSRNLLAHYNQIYFFRQLLPFAKTESELISFSKSKEVYFITFYLKVRCL